MAYPAAPAPLTCSACRVLWCRVLGRPVVPVQVPEEGWGSQHVIVRHEETSELLGCCPMYLKGHSQGEYVFDSSWANYSHMMGKR